MRGGGRRGHETLRSCVACRRRAAPAELVRLVAAGDRILVSRTAPGRGAWICPDRTCFERAVRARALSRALRLAGELQLPDVDTVIAGGGRSRSSGTGSDEVCEDR